MMKEFKAFIMRGNVLDLAIGVIIGGAFGKIVSSLTDDVLMPPIGLVLGKVNFEDLKVVLQQGSKGPDGKELVKEVAISYGAAIQTTISFFLIAFVVFLIVRAYNRFRAKAPPADPSAQEKLLAEIRDLLKR